MRIYVITHKEIELNLPENYVKMLVGAHRFDGMMLNGYELDNKSADNISNKNANYCELTGLYWIWKNDVEDVKGLVHYRRFFTQNRFTNSINYFLSEDEVNKILKNNNIIVGEKYYMDMPTVKDDYLLNHKEKDWEKLKDIIRRLYPEYLDTFELVEKSNWFYPYNMMIATKEVFNSYCEWLFTILFELEKEIDLTGYDVQQARIYGFMSERLLSVWILTNKLKCYEAPVVQLDCRFRYRIRRKLEKIFDRKIKLGR